MELGLGSVNSKYESTVADALGVSLKRIGNAYLGMSLAQFSFCLTFKQDHKHTLSFFVDATQDSLKKCVGSVPAPRIL